MNDKLQSAMVDPIIIDGPGSNTYRVDLNDNGTARCIAFVDADSHGEAAQMAGKALRLIPSGAKYLRITGDVNKNGVFEAYKHSPSQNADVQCGRSLIVSNA